MKKAKLKKIEDKKEQEQEMESYSIKQFILIVVVIGIIFGAFYLITTLVAKPQTEEVVSQPAVIDNELITLSNLLNKKENEYYVLATKPSMYNDKAKYSEIYNNYLKEYKSKEGSLKVYKVDLDNALNKNFISEELKIDNDLTKLKVNNEILFKIKKGKIEKYYVGSGDIISALKNL